MFDWDGTAVPDRRADASVLRDLLETLSRLGCHLVITSGTHLESVDTQLGACPAGPGSLFIDSNRGSEIWEIAHAGPVLRERREPRADENEALDRAAAATVTALA